jgi:hypothetical protein
MSEEKNPTDDIPVVDRLYAYMLREMSVMPAGAFGTPLSSSASAALEMQRQFQTVMRASVAGAERSAILSHKAEDSSEGENED